MFWIVSFMLQGENYKFSDADGPLTAGKSRSFAGREADDVSQDDKE